MRSFRVSIGPRIAPGTRLPVIDEIKGLAILLVVLYHAGGVLQWRNVPHGEIGVDLFLIVSGFTLALSSSTTPLKRFLLRRFLRIFPAYWFSMALFVWLSWHCFGARYSWDDILEHVVGIHGFSRPAYFSSISDPYWFISMIVGAYVVFCVIRSRLDDLSLVIAACGILFALAVVLYQENHHQGGLISLAVRIPSFFAGLLAGRLLGAGTGEIKLNFALGAGLAAFYYTTFMRGTIPAYTLPALGLIAAWIAIRHPLSRSQSGADVCRSLASLGTISYEVYLLHQPLMRDYNLYVYHSVFHIPAPATEQLVRGMTIAMIVTLIAARLLHAAVGRVFDRLGARKAAPEVLPT